MRRDVIVVLNSDKTLLFRDYSRVNFITTLLKEKHGFDFSVELIDKKSTFKLLKHS